MSEHNEAGWIEVIEPDGTRRLVVTMTERAFREMDREQIEMLRDAEFLIKAAFRGKTDGPLTLPATGLPVRT